MARKLQIVLLLSAFVIGFLYVRPMILREPDHAELIDRIPDGEYLIQANLFDFARELSAIIYKYEVPMREFMSHDFILAQAKQHGLNLQKPSYGFINKTKNEEWGFLIELTDSSKVYSGIKRLEPNFKINDTLIGGRKVYQIKAENIYFNYGKSWLLIYKGNQFQKRMYHVMYSEKGNPGKKWRKFKDHKEYQNRSLVVFTQNENLRKYGVESSLFTTENDSINFNLKVEFNTFENIGIRTKDTPNKVFVYQDTKPHLNLNLDINEFRTLKENALYKQILKLGRKISFPTETFLETWNGELSFVKNGTIKTTETIITQELDENFEYSEVKKEIQVDIEAIALKIGTNSNQKKLISDLFSKGIIRKDGKKYYTLLNAPLNMRLEKEKELALFATNIYPKTIEDVNNFGKVQFKGYNFNFIIDNIETRKVQATLKTSAEDLLKKFKIIK